MKVTNMNLCNNENMRIIIILLCFKYFIRAVKLTRYGINIPVIVIKKLNATEIFNTDAINATLKRQLVVQKYTSHDV